jgi:hypothetical protein
MTMTRARLINHIHSTRTFPSVLSEVIGPVPLCLCSATCNINVGWRKGQQPGMTLGSCDYSGGPVSLGLS